MNKEAFILSKEEVKLYFLASNTPICMEYAIECAEKLLKLE
jgi:hypothetical protein